MSGVVAPLVDLPEWATTWPCDACGTSFLRDTGLELGEQILCAFCYMTVGIDPGDVEERIARVTPPQPKFPNGMSLLPYQPDGVRWLARQRIGLIQDEMGMGKTPQILRAVPEDHGLCVICPASLVKNWANEALVWRPELLMVPKGDRQSWSAGGPRFLAIKSYDSLRGIADLRVSGKVVLVFDETQKIKNPATATTAACRRLRDTVLNAGGRVWLSTATPMLNTPDEFWSVLQNAFLGFAAFGGWKKFDTLFADYQKKDREDRRAPSGSDRHALLEALRPVRIRRLKRNHLKDLPPKKIEIVEVNISASDAREIHDHTKRLIAFERAREAVKSGLLQDPYAPRLDPEAKKKRMAVFRQHAEGILLTLKEPTPQEIKKAVDMALAYTNKAPGWSELMQVRAALATAKIGALRQLVELYEEHQEPVVVFSAHRKPIESLGTREGWATITGNVPGSRRATIVRDFQAGLLKGVGITIDAGGVGLTLTRAATAIFVDLDWTPAANEQAEDRIHRIGQTRAATVVRLVANHAIDERVQEVLEQKIALIDALDEEVSAA